MIMPFNNQIKDELVDFIMYYSKPETSGERIVPLLTLTEIVLPVTLLDRLAFKA
jgi:hypothetical protein